MPRADRCARAQKWLLRACVALPLAMLAANLVAWLRWGTDLPFLDDWRAYNERTAGTFGWDHLFQATNNTIAPVGLALDSLAQRTLGGNPIAYQTLSMLAVLGSLLALQWRLLGWAVPQPAVRALAFAATVFMLQSGSYWGEQNLAYHQALPLVALLAAAALNFSVPASAGTRAVGVFALGLLAGLSYISGAVGALLMGATWWVLARRFNAPDQAALLARGRWGGLALGAAGLLTTGLQLAFTRHAGADARGQGMPLTSPLEPDFWLYLAGKLGRATGHGFGVIGLESVWVVLLALALAGGAAWLLARDGRDAARVRLSLVALPLLAVVAAYLAMVALGRAGLRDASIQSAADVFRFGYGRFHFFWVTLLFPWLLAVALAAGAARPAGAAVPARGGFAVLALLLAVAGVRGVFDVPAYYRSASDFRAGEIRCLAGQLGSGVPIVCPGFDAVGIRDWSRAYEYAQDIHASFVRYLPIVARAGFGQELLHWQTPADFSAAHWADVRPLEGGWMQAAGDARMQLALPDARRLAHCRVLGVQLRLQARQVDTVQVFYRFPGQSDDTEARSQRLRYGGDAGAEPAPLEFSIDSATGFAPVLRIDPVDGPGGAFRLIDLRVTCRLAESS